MKFNDVKEGMLFRTDLNSPYYHFIYSKTGGELTAIGIETYVSEIKGIPIKPDSDEFERVISEKSWNVYFSDEKLVDDRWSCRYAVAYLMGGWA